MKKAILEWTILEFIVVILIFLLPFSTSLPNIFLGLSLLLLIIKRKIKWDKIKLLFPFLLFYIYIVFNIFSKNLVLEDSYILFRIILVFLSAIIFLSIKKKIIADSFIFTTNLAIIISMIKLLVYFKINNSIPSNLNEVLLIERPYFGFISLINIFLILNYISQYEFKKIKFIYLVLIILNIVFIFTIAARMSMITILICSILFIFIRIRRSICKKTILILIITSIFSFGLVFNKILINRLKLNNSIEAFIDYEPRFVIWPCAYSIVKEGDFVGYTVGNYGFLKTEKKLVECYGNSIKKEDKKAWYIRRNFNTHNQFLGIIITTGLCGLFFFLFFLVKLFYNSFANFYLFSISISLFLFFIVENIIYRQFGCYVLGFIIAVILGKDEKENKNCTYS